MNTSTRIALPLCAVFLLAGASCDDDGDTESFQPAKLDRPEDAMVVGRSIMEMVGTSATGEGQPTRGPVARLRAMQEDGAGGGDGEPTPCSQGGTSDSFEEQRDVESPYAPQGTSFTVAGTDYDQCRTADATTGHTELRNGREEVGAPTTPTSADPIEYWRIGTPEEAFSRILTTTDANGTSESRLIARARSDAQRSATTQQGVEQLRMQTDTTTTTGSTSRRVVMELGSENGPFVFDSSATGAEGITGSLRYRSEGNAATECALGTVNITTEEPFVPGTSEQAGRLHLRSTTGEATVAFHGDGSATVTIPGQAPRTFSAEEQQALPSCDGAETLPL